VIHWLQSQARGIHVQAIEQAFESPPIMVITNRGIEMEAKKIIDCGHTERDQKCLCCVSDAESAIVHGTYAEVFYYDGSGAGLRLDDNGWHFICDSRMYNAGYQSACGY
jgi:hypothetical protein